MRIRGEEGCFFSRTTMIIKWSYNSESNRDFQCCCFYILVYTTDLLIFSSFLSFIDIHILKDGNVYFNYIKIDILIYFINLLY